jgi:uncharacterized protein with PIN domain
VGLRWPGSTRTVVFSRAVLSDGFDTLQVPARSSRRLLLQIAITLILVPEPMSHDQKACPLCAEHIQKTARGGRRMYSCQNCGATGNKFLTCERCGTKRVWQGKKGAACSGCGAPYTR